MKTAIRAIMALALSSGAFGSGAGTSALTDGNLRNPSGVFDEEGSSLRVPTTLRTGDRSNTGSFRTLLTGISRFIFRDDRSPSLLPRLVGGGSYAVSKATGASNPIDGVVIPRLHHNMAQAQTQVSRIHGVSSQVLSRAGTQFLHVFPIVRSEDSDPKPIVFLSGNGWGIENAAPFAAQLAATFSTDVYTPAYFHQLDSHRDKVLAEGAEQHAGPVIAVLENLADGGHSEGLVLCHSIGGRLMGEVARLRPELVKGFDVISVASPRSIAKVVPEMVRARRDDEERSTLRSLAAGSVQLASDTLTYSSGWYRDVGLDTEAAKSWTAVRNTGDPLIRHGAGFTSVPGQATATSKGDHNHFGLGMMISFDDDPSRSEVSLQELIKRLRTPSPEAH